MVFSDLFFLYFFLPICFIAYKCGRSLQARNMVLLVFSLIFYAWGEPVWVILLVFSGTIDYYHGLYIDKHRGTPKAKRALASSLILNLGILILFKYSGFIVENINALLRIHLPVPKFTLPIGISFYTFQTLSYTIDCYWGKVKVQRRYSDFLMYVSLFPQLVAGPIVRYATIEKEISDRHTTFDDLAEGSARIILGLSKKVIIANNLSTVVDAMFGQSSIAGLSVLGTWYGVIAFALQIYFDFSGYSDMAIGLGRLFGFHFDENFKYPFISKSITEFWQRWHISLGSFFRDYLLYVPIFGKRRKYGGLFLVWFCTGLWHGASWNYVIWGLYFGIFIAIEQAITQKRLRQIPDAIMRTYTILVYTIGFGIFYFEDFGKLGDFFKNLIGLNGNAFSNRIFGTTFVNNIFLFIAAIVFSTPVLKKLKEYCVKQYNHELAYRVASIVCSVGLLLVCTALLVDATNNPFLYFRF